MLADVQTELNYKDDMLTRLEERYEMEEESRQEDRHRPKSEKSHPQHERNGRHSENYKSDGMNRKLNKNYSKWSNNNDNAMESLYSSKIAN